METNSFYPMITKAEILTSNFQKDRIIHRIQWDGHIKNLLSWNKETPPPQRCWPDSNRSKTWHVPWRFSFKNQLTFDDSEALHFNSLLLSFLQTIKYIKIYAVDWLFGQRKLCPFFVPYSTLIYIILILLLNFWDIFYLFCVEKKLFQWFRHNINTCAFRLKKSAGSLLDSDDGRHCSDINWIETIFFSS